MPHASADSEQGEGAVNMGRLIAVLCGAGFFLMLGLGLAIYCFAGSKKKEPAVANKIDIPPPPPAPRPEPAEPASGPPLDKDVGHAVHRSVRYLKTEQLSEGTWPGSRVGDENYPVGYAALPGLTLLECGLPPSDPNIQKAASYVRKNSPDLKNTYELALAILFLDRLGENRRRETHHRAGPAPRGRAERRRRLE